jgi:hypothetical protein
VPYGTLDWGRNGIIPGLNLHLGSEGNGTADFARYYNHIVHGDQVAITCFFSCLDPGLPTLGRH